MTNTISLDAKYSTTKLLTKEKPVVENRPEDKFETVLFLSEGVNIKILTKNFNVVTQRTVERWIKQLKDKKKIEFIGASKPDGTRVKLTDPSKLNALGWKHTVELDEGIEKIYEWYLTQ